MKSTAMKLVVATTVLLILIAITSALDFPFYLVFYLVCLGQVVWIITIYKVLTDDYQTEKTFDDWYEDHPIEKDL